MLNVNNISVRSYFRHIRLNGRLAPKLLQHYLDPNTFENRNAVHDSLRDLALRIFSEYFRPKIGRKIIIFSLHRKNYSSKKRVLYISIT